MAPNFSRLIKLSYDWTDWKEVAKKKSLVFQYSQDAAQYTIYGYDGPEVHTCIIWLGEVPWAIIKSYSQEQNDIDKSDFETNYKDSGNKQIISQVITQYELNDKTLKLSKAKCEVDVNGTATVYMKVPGQFGSGQGRFVVGGYGIAEDYNKDDYVIVRIEDKDRIIAWMIAQSINPNATEPASDIMVQQIGVIPGIGEAFPAYPLIRSYTDEEVPEENRGWYFWPIAQGNNLPPVGEVEINPIGGYGFVPSGFYIKIIYQRPYGVITGSFRANIDWGRKE